LDILDDGVSRTTFMPTCDIVDMDSVIPLEPQGPETFDMTTASKKQRLIERLVPQ